MNEIPGIESGETVKVTESELTFLLTHTWGLIGNGNNW